MKIFCNEPCSKATLTMLAAKEHHSLMQACCLQCCNETQSCLFLRKTKITNNTRYQPYTVFANHFLTMHFAYFSSCKQSIKSILMTCMNDKSINEKNSAWCSIKCYSLLSSYSSHFLFRQTKIQNQENHDIMKHIYAMVVSFNMNRVNVITHHIYTVWARLKETFVSWFKPWDN